MDLSRLQIVARQRSGWQAVDLGFLLARHWYRDLIISWLLLPLLLFVVLGIFLWQWPWAVSLSVWWLKPLWDRLPLYIASQRLFGEQVSARDALLKAPRLFSRQLFAALLWRRFSFSRSHDLPITMLEGLDGAARRRRIAVMHMGSGNAASWVTIICVHLESFMAVGIIVLVAMLIPENVDYDFAEWWLAPDLLWQHGFNLAFLLCAGLVAPFYCLGGFMLYISRRIDLEAWDIEIQFRNLLQTTKSQDTGAGLDSSSAATSGSGSKALGTALLATSLLGFSLAGSDPTLAAPDAQTPNSEVVEYLTPERSRELASEILEGEDFKKIELKSGWRFKETEPEEVEPEIEFPEWLKSVFSFFGDLLSGVFNILASLSLVVKILLGFLLGAALGYLIYMAIKHSVFSKAFGFLGRKRERKGPVPDVMFGLDLRPETLPDDVPAEVQRLWRDKQFRSAMALLYGASLSRLIHRYGFSFRDGYTETECAQIVKQDGSASLAAFIAELTMVWQQLAYGRLTPTDQVVADLCLCWQQEFEVKSSLNDSSTGVNT